MTAPASLAPDRTFAPAPTVLLVEDDETQRSTLARALTSTGHRVLAASGAYEAMRQILRDPPDAAVVDLVLPDASGVDLTRALHAISVTARVPVIVVTAHAGVVETLDPASFGADCVIVKPVSDEQLAELIASCIATRRAEP